MIPQNRHGNAVFWLDDLVSGGGLQVVRMMVGEQYANLHEIGPSAMQSEREEIVEDPKTGAQGRS